MPTVKEIADALGCSKQTVRNNLKSMDLWDTHVTQSEVAGQSALVDDDAAAAVCDAILKRRRTPSEPFDLQKLALAQYPPPAPEPEPKDPMEAQYEARIEELKEQIERLEARLDKTEEHNRELQAQLLTTVGQLKALPSADDVTTAREAGRTQGAADERERIRRLGAWARLRGRF